MGPDRLNRVISVLAEGPGTVSKPRIRPSESASSGFLSSRQRRMRGKRTATPDLWRVERWMPSKPSSKTSSGLTVRTGPNFSTMLRRTNASTRAISSSVSPEYALAIGTSRPVVPDAERVVGVQAGPLAAAPLGGGQHGVDGVRVDLPLPPIAPLPADPVGRLPPLEHQALGRRRPAPARAAASAPRVARDDRREDQPGGQVGRLDQRSRAATVAIPAGGPGRPRPRVRAGRRRSGPPAPRPGSSCPGLPADPPLELREGQGDPVLPRQDLAVDGRSHRAGRRRARRVRGSDR